MKSFLKSTMCALVIAAFTVNCGSSGAGKAGVEEGSVVETPNGDLQTVSTETGTVLEAPSNNLPMEKVDVPSNLLTLLTPPSNTSTTSSGFLGGLGSLFGIGGGNTCGTLSSILSIGASFLAGGNPIVGMIVPQLASSLLNCGSNSSLANLIPTGSSDKQEIFALLSQIMQAQSQGKDPFALLNAIKNPKDLSSLIGIVTQLVGQTNNTEIKGILDLIKNFQSGFGGAVGQCGNMNAKACQVFQIINQIRSQNGLQNLLPSLGCTLAAQSHSKDMFENNILSLIGSNGVTSKARLASFGLNGATESVVKGEKLSAQQVVQMLMGSQTQLQNILNPNFTGGGIGFINGFFTQCFTK